MADETQHKTEDRRVTTPTARPARADGKDQRDLTRTPTSTSAPLNTKDLSKDEMAKMLEAMDARLRQLELSPKPTTEEIPGAVNSERLARTSMPVDEEASKDLDLEAAANKVDEDDRPMHPNGTPAKALDAKKRGDYIHIVYDNGDKKIVEA